MRRLALPAIVLAGAAGAAAQGMPAAPAAAASGPPLPDAAVLVVMPQRLLSDGRLGDGCWVRFHDGTGFKGATLTLVGPLEMPAMDPPGAAWREWNSAVVGPRARVTVFRHAGFADQSASLAPGARAADLAARTPGWFRQVQSARVECTG